MTGWTPARIRDLIAKYHGKTKIHSNKDPRHAPAIPPTPFWYRSSLCVLASMPAQIEVPKTRSTGPKGPGASDKTTKTNARRKKMTPDVGVAPGTGRNGSAEFPVGPAPQCLHFDAVPWIVS